ncbi:MAG: phage holin family protein [Microcoleaceae cyanobacterium MO_207.B10]|nr:phage holin family protein [Microcoleaceae cyanobacterium MO_207.B10]
MVRTLLTLLATALSLLVVDIIFPGVNIATFPVALIAAAAIGIVNAVIRPVIKVVSLPITLVTLGAFSLVVNGFCFWLAAALVPGFQVSGLLSFIIGPVILSFVNTFLSKYFAEKFPQLTSEESAN